MHDSSWSRLRTRLVIGCTGVTVVGLLLIVVDIAREHGKALQGALREAANLSRALDEHSYQALAGADRLIAGIARRAAENGSMNAALPAFEMLLHDRPNDRPQISSVSLIDAKGRWVASTPHQPDPPTAVIAARDYVRHHSEGPKRNPHIGSPIHGQTTGRPIVPISRGVWHDGRFIGVVIAALDIDYFRAAYRSINVGANGVVTLVRLDGATILRVPARGDPVEPVAADPALIRAAVAESPAGTLDAVSAVDGVRRIMSYRVVHDTGLVVAVGFAHADLLAGWYDTLWIEGSAALILILVGATALIILLRSLRQQHRIEDLRVETESLARASEAKTAFLANMSHELRTPLNAVLGFAQLMEQEAFGPLGNRRYREYVTEIRCSGDHLLRLLEGVLDMSAIDAARVKLEEKGFALARLLGDARALSLGKARLRDVGVVIQDGAPGVMLRADLRRLTHVVTTLIEDAIRVSPGGTTVRLAASLEAGGAVAIRVTDHGRGMTADDADRALRPWWQRSSTTVKRGEGSGLGLPLARSVAELHGGQLRFVDDDGPGVTAELMLPAERVIAVVPEPTPLSHAVAAGRRNVFG